MGNTGFRKLFFLNENIETSYQNIYDVQLMDINREKISLGQYKDNLCLIVNLSSHLRDSIEKINELKEIKAKFPNIKILGFPSNQFGNEPDDFLGLKKFYFDKMNINFPIFAKIDINGKYTCHLYKYLKKNSELYDDCLLTGKPIRGDFAKFLVKPDGKVHKFYDNNISKAILMNDIEQILNNKK